MAATGGQPADPGAKTRRTALAVLVAALALAVLIAIALISRSENRALQAAVPFAPNSASDAVVLGVVQAAEGPGRTTDVEVERGLRLWIERLAETGGARYGDRVAAVRLDVERVGATGRDAANAANRLIDRGATTLVGPADPDQLAATADVALRRRVPLMSAVPRPVGVRQIASNTFLARPDISRLTGSLDLLDRIVGAKAAGTKRGRIVIAYTSGRWGLRAVAAARAAGERQYDVEMVRLTGREATPLVRRLRRDEPDLVAVFARSSHAEAWFRAAAGTRAPWVLAVDDVGRTIDRQPDLDIAMEVPWSPRTSASDPFFKVGEFARDYEAAYGSVATADAAAGVTLGVIISMSADRAKSVDPSRLIAARDSIETGAMWGPLKFRKGEQEPFPSSFVFVLDGVVYGVPNSAAGRRALRRSVPPAARERPAARAAPTQTPAPEPTPAA